LFLTACLAISLALEEPTLARQAFALGTIGLATATRVQGLLLFGVLAVAAIVVRRDALRRLAPSLVIAGVVGAVVVVRLALGNLGVYEVQARAGYSVTGILGWTLRDFGELALSVGIVPVAALLSLRPRSLRDRIFVAVTGTATAVLVGLAAVAASWEPQGLKERYMFYVGPLLLLALVVWIERGAVARRWMAVPPAVLAAVLPLGRLFREPSLLGNAWGLLPFERAGLTAARILLVVGAAGACALFLFAPRLAIAGVALFLAASTVVVYSSIRNQSRAVLALSGLKEKGWLHGVSAKYLNLTAFEQETAERRFFEEWVPVWETEFWNRSFAGVVTVGTADEPAPFFQEHATLDWRTGRVVGADASYVIADKRFRVAGALISTSTPLWLFRASTPLRLAWAVEGLRADGTMAGGKAALTLWSTQRVPEFSTNTRARFRFGSFEALPGGGARLVGKVHSLHGESARGAAGYGPVRIEVDAPAGTRVTWTSAP
jgi:hypothetical protein